MNQKDRGSLRKRSKEQAALNIQPSDLQGIGRLAITATTNITDLVETVHSAVMAPPRLRPTPAKHRTRGITGFVYRSVRGVTHLVGGAIDLALAPAVAMLETTATTDERESLIAALNGVVGDHLAATHNPLAIQPALRRNIPATEATNKVVILVHGLCMNDRQWQRKGHDHGAALAHDLGYTPLYIHYNSGQHISTNGRILADLLETTLADWPQPVDEVVIIGHSMGGLVARSACHYAVQAAYRWPEHLRKLVFLGTPHHGSPLERGGNLIDIGLGSLSYTAAFSMLGKLRSAGITDLRHGSLLDEDWLDHDRFAHNHDTRQPLPLPERVHCYAIAAALDESEAGYVSNLLGDGLVPIASAHGRHAREEHHLAIPEAQRWTGYGMHHLDLLDHPAVYAQLHAWLKEK
jgi:pimeloyl-ACP methyl ester carboxylesterase